MRKYDSYKDSGIEWIGEIPSHWDITRMKFHLDYQKGKNPKELKFSETEGSEVYLAMDYLRGNPKQMLYVEDVENYVKVDDNEILLLWDGSNAGEFILSKTGILSSTMAVLNLKNIQKDYSWYFFKHFEPQLKESTIGMGVPHVNGEELKNGFVALPSPEEQTAIATYLDRKTAEIDELIADKKRLLELYEEEKTAIINQAVTKGINPDVPMKDSGIEWLGEIPEHWEVKKIGHCGKIVRGGSPRPTGDPRYFFGDYIHWITVKEVTNAVGKYVVCTEEYLTEEGSKNSRIVEPETLLLSNSGATLGVPKISKIRGCINDGSVAFPELKAFLNRDYLYYFFVSHTDIYREQMAGNGQPNLNTEIIKSTFIPIPSTVDEQTAIVEFIESDTQKVNAKKYKTEKLIELLTEYRTALISEVVTGKIKVIE